ncbi:carbonic anhydrase [Methylocapsa sp. S129]|uniref:carbonic anhydrase n=1 Tax=Methylocapsa sp. S129 TaxID=1641869 RepID=UPI00131D74D0|nr:carbonic anhydrase [Methylocapsa sp. S129]
MCKTCELEGAARCARPSRRVFLASFSAAAATLPVAGAAWAKDAAPPPKPQNAVSPDGALELLHKGNDRYVDGVSKRHDFKNEREALTAGQNPYAAILSCADSRIAPEYAFDSGRGDLFVCRVAGNFANDDTIASFEYAVANLNVPLIMVLGHDSCGAISATIKSLNDKSTLPGHLPSLVARLASAVKAGAEHAGDPFANAIRQNVIDTVAALKSATPILDAAVAQQKLKIVGGIYRLATGRIEMVA